MQIFKLNFGAVKAIGERALNYFGKVVALVNLVMLLNISNLLGADVMSYFPIAVGLFLVGVVFMIFDILVIFPQENQYVFEKNPTIQEMRSDIKQIKEKIINGN